MENPQIELFNSFRKFVDRHAAHDEAVIDIEAVKPIYRKAVNGAYELSPPGLLDRTGIAAAISLATGMNVDKIAAVSASGTHADLDLSLGPADLLQMMYQAVLGRDNAGRLSWHVADRHGRQSRLFLPLSTVNRLHLVLRDGVFSNGLTLSIRSGYGGALINRLQGLYGADDGIGSAMADMLIDGFRRTMHACVLPYLSYSLAGYDEGVFTLMPLIECLETALPLCEIADQPGTWLVLAA